MAFVGANGAMGFLNAQFAYDPRTEDMLRRSMVIQLRQVDHDHLISTRMEGLGSDTASSLSELGISSMKRLGC